MASNTTYGDYLAEIRTGFHGVGIPLTMTGFVVLGAGLVIANFNPLAAVIVVIIGFAIIWYLSRRDSENRSKITLADEKYTYRSQVKSKRNLYKSGLLSPVYGGQTRLPGILSKISIIEAKDGFGDPFILLKHGKTGEVSLPIVCTSQGAALIDDDVEDSYVAAWAGLLEWASKQPGITQLSATIDTSPDSGIRFKRILKSRLVKDAPDLAARAMSQIMSIYTSGGARSDVTITATFRFKDIKGRILDDDSVIYMVALLIPEICTRLAHSGGGKARPMILDEAICMARVCMDPKSQDMVEASNQKDALAWEDAGPTSAEAGWDWYRHDSGVSRSWEMVDPPQSAITSTTMAHLFAPSSSCDRKRVTVIFHLLPPKDTRSITELNRKKARALSGQDKLSTALNESTIDTVDRQADQASRQGAVLVFFGMLVTATIESGDNELERLDTASRAVEAAAGGADVNLRPCYAAQDTAFAASLPFGINLRSYKFTSAFGLG